MPPAGFDLSELNLTERENVALAGLEWWERQFIHQRIRERMPYLLADELSSWVDQDARNSLPDPVKLGRREAAINKLLQLAAGHRAGARSSSAADHERRNSSSGNMISHAQAREAAARLIHSAFNPLDRTAKLSIPAQDSDDDILLVAYIAQQENLEMLRKGRLIPAEASHS